MGYAVKLDTNGSNPDILINLINENLIDYVAMDIKNSPEKYSITCGCDVNVDKIKESVSIIIESGINHEFRTTTVREYHSAEDFEAIAQWLKGDSKYFLQHFEDSGNLIGENLSPLSKDEMTAFAESMRSKLSNVDIRGV